MNIEQPQSLELNCLTTELFYVLADTPRYIKWKLRDSRIDFQVSRRRFQTDKNKIIDEIEIYV